ncbi:reverse transcriptase domain-containing protein [Tanacetum coccineum]
MPTSRFYRIAYPSDQDSLNAAASGNLLERSAQDVLKIIENKSKVRTSRNKPIVSQVKASNVHSSEIASAMTVMFKQHQVTPASASVKAIEESCVTCGGAHSYRQCPATDGNTFLGYQDNIQGYVSATAVNYNQGNTGYCPQSVANQIRPPAPIDEPVVAPKPKPSIPYPSRANKQKLCEKVDNLASNFVEIFRELHFELSFVDAFLHMPKFASIKFHFPADFVVVDYVVDPRVPLILGRPFLRTARALIDVYGEELTLRVDDEAITFKVGQTSRYSYNDVVSINRIDVIDVACEEYAQEVLGFSDSSTSGNPTPSLDPILSTSSPSLTSFEEGDFILEEIEAYLTNDSIPPGIDDDDFDLEGDLLLLEKLLNEDPSSTLPPKELHVEELKIIKSSIDDPLELELNDLPSHLEYAFLERTDKLPVIIAKNIKEDDKV